MAFNTVSYVRLPFIIRRLGRNRRLTPQALRAVQDQKLRALVQHSYAHVPYYRRLFKTVGLYPDAIRSVNDLSKIPITTKGDIRDLPIQDLTANNVDLTKCLQSSTSGTTGIPLIVYRDRRYELAKTARKLLTDFVCGDKIWYRRAIFTQWTQEQPQFYHRFGIFPTHHISPFKDVNWQFDQLAAFKPHTIFTLPSHALTLANTVRERGRPAGNVRLIIVNGELLDDPARHVVEDAFAADMFERYGSTEVPRIYAECRDHACHIQSDQHLIQVTRRGETLGLDEEGEITATDLDNYVMPFLRYNQEDIGCLLDDTCTCECHYPLMHLTAGRRRDSIQLPDHRVVPAHYACLFLRTVLGVKQFQVVQEQRDRLRVILVQGDDFQDTVYAQITQEFHRLLGTDVAIAYTLVDGIARERTGKLLAFKTHLPAPTM